MAKIILSGLLQDMVGSAGSNTYSKWKGIHYFRLKAATVTNPRTTCQSLIRSTFTTAAKGWGSLTSSQRALFAQYAESHGSARNREKREGTYGIMSPAGRLFSGMNAKIACDTAVASGGLLAPLTKPPINKAPTITSFAVKFQSVGNFRADITVTPVAPVDTYVYVSFKSVLNKASSYIMTNIYAKSGTPVPAKILASNDTVSFAGELYVRVGHGADIDFALWGDVFGDMSSGPYANKIIGWCQARCVTVDGAIGTATGLVPLIYKVIP